MPAWNAAPAAAIARLAQFPWKQVSAVPMRSLIPCWEERAASVAVPSHQMVPEKADAADWKIVNENSLCN